MEVFYRFAVFQKGCVKGEGGGQLVISKGGRDLLRVHVVIHNDHGGVDGGCARVNVPIRFSRRDADHLVGVIGHNKLVVRGHKVEPICARVQVLCFDRQLQNGIMVGIEGVILNIDARDRICSI